MSSTGQKPWQIDIPDSQPDNVEAAIKTALEFAVLAPSTHNSQPWSFSVDDNKVKITLGEPELRFSDPDGRFAAISLGACVETFAEALAAIGYLAEEKYSDAGVRFTVKKVPNQSVDKKGLRRIVNRYSEKTPFSSKPVSDTDLNTLSDSSDLIRLTNDKETITKLADIYLASAQSYGTNKGFARELRSWMRLGRRTVYGMPAASSGIRPLQLLIGKTMLILSPKSLVPFAQKYKYLVGSSSAVGCICVRDTSFQEAVKAGRAMQRQLLKAAGLGLSGTPLAAIIAHEPSKQKLVNIMQLKAEPIIFIRFCKAKPNPIHTPRASAKVKLSAGA